MYESQRDYNSIESRKTELNDSNIADIPVSTQESGTTEIESNIHSYLSNEVNKKTFTSAFKSALEIRNEKRLQVLDNSETDRCKKSPVKEVEINQTKTHTSINDDSSSAQNSILKDSILHMQISNDFVCAQKIESNTRLFKSGASSSKSKTRRSKTDKSIKKVGKSVYEQILASARSPLKATNKTLNISPEIESKTVDNIVEPVKNKDKTIEGKGKNKRSRESIERQADDVKPVEKKRVRHKECNNSDSCISDESIDKKITGDKIDTETVRNNIHTISNIDITNEDSTSTKKDKIKMRHHNRERTSETNSELKNKESTQPVHSKHHASKCNKRLIVPADKAMQFKTAEILKSYLMKYYPSERIPDRATFSKTCREMHYNILRKKIFGEMMSYID